MACWPPVRQHGLFKDPDDSDSSLELFDTPHSGHRVYTSTKASDSARVHQGDILHGNTIHNHFHVASSEYPPPDTYSSNVGSEFLTTTPVDGHLILNNYPRENLERELTEAQKREELERKIIEARKREDLERKINEARKREKVQVKQELRAQKYETLAESLRFLRMSARLLNIEQAAFETCRWIFQHDAYLSWMDDSQLARHHGFMWIKGKPGSGKSTIMKLLHDSATSASRHQIVISYFFNGRASGDLEKSSLGLLRYLVSQILKVLPSIREQFLTRFESKVFNDIVDEWTATELKSFLSDVLCTSKRPPVNIFIDALDEGHIDDVRQLVTYLEQLTIRAVSNHIPLRVCLSSRHYPHITIRKGLPLMLDEEHEHNQDIRIFVQATLELQAKTLLNEICKRAAGVFLWVVLVVPRLNAKLDEGADLNAAKVLLQKLPTDLDALFTGILDRDAEDIDECIELLQWVSFAQTALSPESLYEALRIASGDTLLTISEVPDKERLRRFFLHRSRGLLEVTQDQRPVVQFIHETVRTFLLTPHGLPRIRPVLARNLEGSSHEMLKQFCLTFLIQHQSSYENLIPQLHKELSGRLVDGSKSGPLLPKPAASGIPSRSCCSDIMPRSLCLHEYAVYYIFRHANIAESHGVSQQSLFTALEEKKLLTILCHCFLLYGSIAARSSELFLIREHEKYSPIATTGGDTLVQLVRCMVGVEQQFTLFSSALATACALQNANIARLIVEGGLKNNHKIVTEIKRYSCFSPAALKPLLQETIHLASVDDMKTLLDLGIAGENGLGTALQAAVYSNRKDMFELLIEAGADVNLPVGTYGTVLQAAAWSPDVTVETIELLLVHGASIDVRTGMYGSALHAASMRASSEIMSDEGAEHDRRKCHAANRGACKIATVEALLRRNAKITVEDWQEPGLIQAYHELFSFSAENGWNYVVNLLLNATIEDDSTDGKATCALWGAALFGGSRQISMLLKHGAKPPSEGVHLHSRDCERWIWDRFKESRLQLTSHFKWLAIHDDGYCRGEEDSTNRFIDDCVFNT